MTEHFPFQRYHVPILVRALKILELLSGIPGGCGASEAAGRLRIPKNTAFRILSTLADHGYLSKDEEGKLYRLDRKLLNLGYAAIDESSLVEKSMDVLRTLRDMTGESAFLAVRLGDQGVVVEQVPGLHPVKVMLQIGHRFPMHTSAPGKALMAYLPEDELDSLLKKISYARYTSRTITCASAMRRELRRIRRTGYALDRAEEIEGLHCVGAAVLDQRGRPLAAIWIGGMASALPRSDFKRLGAMVRDAAAQISRRFGNAGRTA